MSQNGIMKKRIPLCLIFFLVSVALCLTGCGRTKRTPLAKEGVIDLTGWDFERDGNVALDGDWEFYWKRLLEPEDFISAIPPEKTGYFQIPRFWNSYRLTGKPLKADGYATFRLKVIVNTGRIQTAIRVEDQATAYKLWVNETPLLGNGVVGTSRESMTPQYLAQISEVNPADKNLQLILQVSNYHLNSGGPNRRIWLGHEQKLRRGQMGFWTIDLLLFGCLVIIGLYHVVFYALRRKHPSPLYFGLSCLLWGIRIPFVGTGGKFVTVLFPAFPWEIALKIDLIAWYLAIPLIMMFISTLYPAECSGKVIRFFQGVGLLFSLTALLFPGRISGHSVIPYEVVSTLSFFYICLALSRAALRKRAGAVTIICGFMLLFFSGVNDILYDNNIISTGYLVPVGMLAMILSQSLVLSGRFARSFTKIERLSQELKHKNIELSRVNRLKDQFLANTSHELRTPLNGIIGISESLISGAAGKLSSKVASNLSLVVSSAKRLANLINDLIDFSRLKNRDIELLRKPVDICALADTILMGIAPSATGKALELFNKIPKNSTALNNGWSMTTT